MFVDITLGILVFWWLLRYVLTLWASPHAKIAQLNYALSDVLGVLALAGLVARHW